MSLVNRLQDLAHRINARDYLPEAPESPAKEEASGYPAYFDELDDIQKQIYHSPFGPDGYPIDAWSDPYYETWFLNHRATEDELDHQRATQNRFSFQPKFSIIVPLYKTPLEYFRTMADSVLTQTYGRFQLVLVNASTELPELAKEIERYQAIDSRITVVNLKRNLGITENTNRGINVADGDYCCFLDHDDFIEPDLLFEYVCAIDENPDTDILYCDEDLVELDHEHERFRHLHPMFKPQFSPELLLCKNYVVHFMAIRRTLIYRMPHRDSRFDGTQDYNMLLSCSESARRITAVNKVLYHWRVSTESTATNPDAKPYSRHSYKLSVLHHLNRTGIFASIISSGIPNNHTLWFHKGERKVSLIVDCPTASDVIERIIETLKENGAEGCYEVILLSANPQPLDLPAQTAETRSFSHLIRIVDSETLPSVTERFNLAASLAEGDYLVFLDASCSFITPEPLQQISALCSLDGVGIAAPKCLYRDGSVKSFGVSVTSRRIMPLYRGYPDDFPAYQCNARTFQNASACSLQGMCVKRDLFLDLNGFDERFGGEIAAADFCKRVHDRGLRIVVTPTVKIETSDNPPEAPFDFATNAKDYPVEDLQLYDQKWPDTKLMGDPYLNSNLDQESPYFQLPRP